MEPSSAICLAQEAVQRERAAATRLPSVKALAEQAADVWNAQAIAARLREAREAARVNRARFARAIALEGREGVGATQLARVHAQIDPDYQPEELADVSDSFSGDLSSQAAGLSSAILRIYGVHAQETAEKNLNSAKEMRDQPLIDLWQSVRGMIAA